jgi:hypothetical protein
VKIADLFIDLTIKGGDKAKESLQHAEAGLQGVVSSGLAGKAAILGVVYGLEQIAGSSIQSGTNLANFNAEMNLSVEMLQKHQYAARKFGITDDQTEQAIRNIKRVLTAGGEGLQMPAIQKLIKDTGLDVGKAQDHPEYVIATLQKYFKGGDAVRKAIYTEALGANALIPMFVGEDKDIMQMHPYMKSLKSAQALRDIGGRFSNFKQKWGGIADRETLEFGPGIMTNLEKATTTFLGLEKAVRGLATAFPESTKAIESAGLAIFAYLNPITGSVLAVTKLLSDWQDYKKESKEKAGWSDNSSFFANFDPRINPLMATPIEWFKHMANAPYPELGTNVGRDFTGDLKDMLTKAGAVVNFNTVIEGNADAKTVDVMHAKVQQAIRPLLQGQKK